MEVPVAQLLWIEVAPGLLSQQTGNRNKAGVAQRLLQAKPHLSTYLYMADLF